jgi:hypothetical protein
MQYNTLIDCFKEVDGRFPDSLREVYLAYNHDYPEDIGQIELRHFIDVFSKDKEWIGYFPIYDNEDTQIVSYVILSAGIDGTLNNVINSSDKLHLNNWKQKLKLYNPDEFDGISIYSDEYDKNEVYPLKVDIDKPLPYNAREAKSGDKDLLIVVHHFVHP